MANVKITVGRIDNSTQVEVSAGTSVLEGMRAGGYTKTSSEKIQDLNQNEYTGDEIVENGRAYFLVQSVKSGN